MISLLIGFLLVVIACDFIVVRKTYLMLPQKELKRRASRNGENYAELYRAVAYESSLKALLWLLIILPLSLGLVIISQKTSIIIALLIVGVLIYLSLIWLPNSRLSKLGQKITLIYNPVIVWVLGYIDPVFKKIASKTEQWSHKDFHTGLFEKKI
jgi:hypothetical protein